MGGSSVAVLAVLLFSWLPSLWAPGPAANRKGNRAFQKGKYTEALSQYDRAKESLPGERVLSLNSGTTLLQEKKYDEALRSLMTAAGDPRAPVRSRAFYNAGNGLADTQKLPEAMAAYRQAILADPRDEDAKFNYELARRLMQAQQQQQQQDRNRKNDQSSQQQQQQSGGQSREQQNQQQQQPEQQQNPNQPKQGPDEQRPPQDQQQVKSLMSKEDAERLMDAVKANETERIKARLKSKRKKDVEKDW